MGLSLPGNIPVAAESYNALLALGSPRFIRDKTHAVVIVTGDQTDPSIVWASPKLSSYRAVWAEASQMGLVDPAREWGDNVDIDHVFPKSWAGMAGLQYVRLFPVWSEINRSAGGGREKAMLHAGIAPRTIGGIVFAEELQVLKILGHPVGTASDPVSIFRKRGKR